MQFKRNHLDFSKGIIFVEKYNSSKIVSGVQNLLYSAISEILLGKRPGVEGEQNLAVWRTGIANGKFFLMLVTVPFLWSFKEGYCDISPSLNYFCAHLYLWLRHFLVLYFKGFNHFYMKPLPWFFSILDENCPLQLEIPINCLVSHTE